MAQDHEGMAQDHEGLSWVWYDSAFRRQATLSGNKKWSVVNSTLFTMNFSGRSSGTRRCKLCYATSHSEGECVQRGDPDTDVGQRLRSLESVILAMAKPLMPRPSPASARLRGRSAGNGICQAVCSRAIGTGVHAGCVAATTRQHDVKGAGLLDHDVVQQQGRQQLGCRTSHSRTG